MQRTTSSTISSTSLRSVNLAKSTRKGSGAGGEGEGEGEGDLEASIPCNNPSSSSSAAAPASGGGGGGGEGGGRISSRDGLLPQREPVRPLLGAPEGAGIRHAPPRRRHRRPLLLRRRPRLLGPQTPPPQSRRRRPLRLRLRLRPRLRRRRRLPSPGILFLLQLALIIWSYCMVVCSDPGAVPENWRPMPEEDSLRSASPTALSSYAIPDSRDPTSSTSEDLERRQTMRYCTRCQNGKPPRCHHCSVCDRCVLKMDHHCVWVVNCVGARNYKFFLLFLVYTFLETVLDTLSLLPHFIGFFGDARKHSGSPSNLAITFLAFVLNLAFTLSLFCFLCMHASLVLSNTTSIEIYEKKKAVAWKYDLGKKKNFEQVFGTNKLLWFLPLYSAADQENISALQGLDFPTRSDVEV